MKYSKPALSIPQQIARLQGVGLQIPDVAAAQQALQFISYFRLKGYFLPFMTRANQSAPRTFLPGTTFDQILDLYQFDRQLRVLVMDEVERLEVAIRTVICNALSLAFGPHWYLTHHRQIFNGKFDHPRFLGTVLKETMRSKDAFASHYYDNYDHPMLPPSWVVAECLTFGEWSRLFADLKTHQRQIAQSFKLPPDIFESWIHALGLVRNVCAHHGRLWNRRHSIRIAVLHRHAAHFRDTATCYTRMVIIRLMTQAINGQSDFPPRLKALIASRPAAQVAQMGFPNNWHLDPLWV